MLGEDTHPVDEFKRRVSNLFDGWYGRKKRVSLWARHRRRSNRSGLDTRERCINDRRTDRKVYLSDKNLVTGPAQIVGDFYLGSIEMDVRNRIEHCFSRGRCVVGIVLGLSSIGCVMAAWVSG
jgi:hypothetical protein